jgi:hypothetical protein
VRCFSQSYSQFVRPHWKPNWVDWPQNRPPAVVWAQESDGQQLSGTPAGARKQPKEQSVVDAVTPLVQR